jgi:hypothetical protein
MIIQLPSLESEPGKMGYMDPIVTQNISSAIITDTKH